MNKSVWYVQQSEKSEYLVQILNYLFPEYIRLFGEKTMKNEDCLVYNSPLANCPMLVTNTLPIGIRLAQKSLSYWGQTIFQLSHEMCHYAIRQWKIKKDFTLSWFEEIVCEAMSLYALYWSAENWEKCNLFLLNPSYRDSISGYLFNELKKTGTDGFQKCTNIELLKHYNAEEYRESHLNERNRLYYEIVKNPLLCRCFCDYQKYTDKNNVTINFAEWEKHDSNPLVRFLYSIQPCKDNMITKTFEVE